MAEKSERARKEEEILKFWQENKIFEKSFEKGGKEFVFYDGPPFATGLPHYGHILPGTIKDVIPRYKTMRGYRVPRIWGWDCHGLPVENLVEKELGLENKKDIEKFGIAEFNKRARESVLRYEKDWKEIIPRTGRWIDMDNAYKTMDSSYTESVWWSFKNLYDKGLVYKGFKSMHLCPRCETTLSNFEVSQGYKDVKDISVYMKFELIDEPNTYLLAWTTTPWTLPGNVALAVNPEMEYVKIESEGDNYIVAKSLVEKVLTENHEVKGNIKGKDLVGKKYKTLFDYYLKESEVYGANFVTADEGTGIVHIAPAFGDNDYELSLKENLPFIQHVGTDGKFKPEVKDFAGMSVKPKSDDDSERLSADIAIIRYLQEKGNFFDKKNIVHSYPHCWRCDTPLLNYASSSWFMRVADFKNKLVSNNKKVKWLPEDIRDGRFGKWLLGARDWAISRSRFWGTPLPVWQNEDGESLVIDSVSELKKYVKRSRNKYFVMRHGEANSNANDVLDLTGDPNNHLTEKGKESAKKAKIYNPDIVISSPFLRAQETAKLVTDKFETDKRIQERAPNENVLDIRKRMGEFIFDLENKYQNKTILIISHGGPLFFLEKVAKGERADVEEEGIETGEVLELDFASYPHNEDYELDLHRPYIDEIVLEKDGEEYKRVPEVFDTWYDSGSVPFASRNVRELNPADFIAEGLDQTRGWFYTLAVLGTALFGKVPYKQVVVNGLILAEDGKKMSKRLNNYPELSYVLDKYGADALRYYLISSQAVRAEDLAFSEKSLDEVVKKNLNRLENITSFYEFYSTKEEKDVRNKNILDRWIEVRLAQLIEEVTNSLEKYELDKASRVIADFLDDCSNWYLRRSRNRLYALPKLKKVLIELSKIMAPFMPFIAEDVYRRLGGDKQSVHLENWPKVKRSSFLSRLLGSSDNKLLKDMEETRRLISLTLEQRQKANIKVRQPLQKLIAKSLQLEASYIEIIKDEINVKEIVEDQSLETEVWLDTALTPELVEEGRLRDAIRAVQEWRKEQGLKPGEIWNYKIPESERKLFMKNKLKIENSTNVKLTEN